MQKSKKITKTSGARKVAYSSMPTKLSKGWVDAAGIWKGKKMREALKQKADSGREWEKRLEKMYKI